MRFKVILTTLVLLGLVAAAGLAVENKGAEIISIAGGKQGTVAFPHHKHQNKLGDCQICHAVFPQKKDAIEQMKAQGKLKPKDVMNKQCLKCHRAARKAGNHSGPVSCMKCHKR